MNRRSYVDADARTKLIPLKDQIVAEFSKDNWLELGTLTDCLDVIQAHDRLLRSLFFNDPDYPGAAFEVLIKIVGRDSGNLQFIERYLRDRFGSDGEIISSAVSSARKIVFTPSVFTVPDDSPDGQLVSVMMPFTAEFGRVHTAIKHACDATGYTCKRADDIWEHSTVIQDIFSLIFRSFIVICDFSGRNPNVFYEAGIAHTLGKHVIPITQAADDVPFDLRHHRYVRYLNNQEGRQSLSKELEARLGYLASQPSASLKE